MFRCPVRISDLIPALLLLHLSLMGCSPEWAGGAPVSPPKKQPASVRVARPVPVLSESSYPSSLYVERDVILTARSSGIIEKVLADRGSRVKTGDPLAILETDLASRELEKREQALKLAEVEFEQLRSLHEQKIASSHDFLVASITRDQASTDVELARAVLERCHVRAPFDGVVVERWAVVGQRVVEDDSTPLFRMVASDPLRARVNVPEGRLPELKSGQKAIVDPGEDVGPPQEARIVFLGPAVDAASGTAPVIVEVLSRAASLRLGASVRVRFDNPRASPESSLVQVPLEVFPGESLARDSEVDLLVIDHGRAALRRVRVVETRGSSVVVKGPLRPSDQVILQTAGIQKGQPVLAGEELR
jgi:membrane fusion protein, multidrug efflux system